MLRPGYDIRRELCPPTHTGRQHCIFLKVNIPMNRTKFSSRWLSTLILGSILTVSFLSLSCQAVQEITQAMANISQLKFRLNGVREFQLAGIRLAGKSSLRLADSPALLSSVAQNKLPASFTLEVAAINPNDGSAGTTRTSATVAGFAWTLLIDNTPTITGDLDAPVTIPGSGQQVLIPVRMNLDLIQFFENKGLDNIVNLALALGGSAGSASRLTLRARPTIQTTFGSFRYPQEINIIDREFR